MMCGWSGLQSHELSLFAVYSPRHISLAVTVTLCVFFASKLAHTLASAVHPAYRSVH